MVDISKTIKAKSDQLNADDLIGSDMILKVTNVRAPGGDQPVVINYEGDGGKPYKPSKGMRRVLVAAWGKDGSKYIGRSMRVFYEPTVTWAGEEVGGIRISQLTDLDTPVVLALALNGRKKISYTVRPLVVEQKKDMTMEQRQEKTIEMLKEKNIELDDATIEMIKGTEKPEDLKTIYETLTTTTKE